MQRLLRVVLAACALVALARCSRPQASPAPTIRWGACPNYPELAGVAAECTFIPVPLNPSTPDKTIPLFVARVRGSAPEEQKRGQLWFVTGGPGASVIGFVKQSRDFAALRPEWDFYAFEHRGVGNSAPLSCAATGEARSVSLDQAAGCLAELQQTRPEGLENFTVTNAAEDLARAIDALRPPGREVVVYGVSYGTYMVQRYLALHGDQPSAAVLDSIVPASRPEYDDYDRNVNDAAHAIMDRCAQDALCRDRLASVAPSPRAAMTETLDRVGRGALCPALQALQAEPLTRSDLQLLFGSMTERIALRPLMPAVVLRLLRCEDRDVAALEKLLETLYAPEPVPPVPNPGPGFAPYPQVKFSAPLYTHIVLSEMWAGTPLAQVEREEEGLEATLDVVPSLAALADARVWPVYQDPNHSLRAHTDRPVLMLNSDLDPQTPLAEAQLLQQDLNGPTDWFVPVPDAGHIVILDSPMSGTKGETPGDHCGTRILLSFLDAPARPPDTSCIAGLHRLTFDPADPTNQATSQEFFGTADLWGETAPGATAP